MRMTFRTVHVLGPAGGVRIPVACREANLGALSIVLPQPPTILKIEFIDRRYQEAMYQKVPDDST